MLVDPKVIAEPVRWLGETRGFWVQTGLLAISAIGAVWIVYARGIQERRRATVDAIIHQKAEQPLREARLVIRRMHESGEKNAAKHLENPDSAEYKAILEVLNAYEFISSGVRQRAFDEDTYKRLRYFNVIKDWRKLCRFAEEFREDKNLTLFQDFKWLALRWEKSPLEADEKRRPLT
jgi:hypothetical protein